MRSWILAVSLLAAAGTAGPVAQAADLDEGPPPNRYGSVYDDPRYADIYRRPERPPAFVPPPPPYAGPLPRERVYRDDADVPPYAGPHRYSYNEGRPGYGAACVPREVIRERLTRHGWQDFHDGALQGEVAVVRARRPSGRLFELTIERCSGEIVSAYPLESRVYGPYAYGPRPWWQRPY
jgi:hypothetical protein